MEKESFKQAYLQKIQTMYNKKLDQLSINDRYAALGSLIRDYINPNWVKTNSQYSDKGEKQLYYFSIEFLLGKLLDVNLLNMGLTEVCTQALADLGIDVNDMLQEEPDAGLGNGGLGRLAACFLDSMASLSLPGHGCGIRYKYGLFEQKVVNSNQVEVPDNWLKDGYIWEYRKSDKGVEVWFGGSVKSSKGPDSNTQYIHEGYETVMAVPYDIPV
ncbi:MAG: glycogen/starch/alpha-glucan phosphorylase, partial [Sporomusaceae bacterium]|nr:glycogen/starch/alpha-glucan phosphorylase [Sporomusaceae bacterium]